MRIYLYLFFFFNDTATTEIYTLSLHDALPISRIRSLCTAAASRDHPPLARGTRRRRGAGASRRCRNEGQGRIDRKSTRLNSSHGYISYAVFCLKKKKHHESLTICSPQRPRRTC